MVPSTTGQLIIVIILGIFFLHSSARSEKSAGINSNQKNILEDIYSSIRSSDTSSIGIVMFLESDQCWSCLSGEIMSGWSSAPRAIQKHIQTYALMMDGKTPNNFSFPASVLVIPYKGKENIDTVRTLSGTACIFDSRGKIAASYKIGKTEFSKTYRYVDSLLFHQDSSNILNSLIPVATVSLPIGDNISLQHCKITIEPELQRIQIFSPGHKKAWLLDMSGKLIRTNTLAPSDKYCVENRQAVKHYQNFYYLSDSTGVALYIYRYNLVDTVINNKESIMYRGAYQVIDSLWFKNADTVMAWELLTAQHTREGYDCLIKSSESSSIWLPLLPRIEQYHQFALDTMYFRISGARNRMDSLAFKVTDIRPIWSFSGAATDLFYYYITDYGQLFRFGAKGGVLHTPLSYSDTLMQEITTSYSNGILSVQYKRQDGNRYAIGYSKLGLRSTPLVHIHSESQAGFIDENNMWFIEKEKQDSTVLALKIFKLE